MREKRGSGGDWSVSPQAQWGATTAGVQGRDREGLDLGQGHRKSDRIPEASLACPTRERSQLVLNAVSVPRGLRHGPAPMELITQLEKQDQQTSNHWKAITLEDVALSLTEINLQSKERINGAETVPEVLTRAVRVNSTCLVLSAGELRFQVRFSRLEPLEIHWLARGTLESLKLAGLQQLVLNERTNE